MGDADFMTLTNCIRKKIRKIGVLGRKPALGWKCEIGLFSKGFSEEETLVVTVGNGCCLRERLLERCVESMLLSEESSFILQLNKNETQEVDVVLKAFLLKKPYIFQWTDNEKLEASSFYKSLGTELFKNKEIEEAFYKFGQALKIVLTLESFLEKDDPGEKINSLRIALYNNLSSCQLHFKNYDFVIKLCSDSLSVEKNLKAFYRRSLAYIELKEYEKAENDILEVLKLEPKNKAALEKYKLIRGLDKSNRESYEAVVRRMFR